VTCCEWIKRQRFDVRVTVPDSDDLSAGKMPAVVCRMCVCGLVSLDAMQCSAVRQSNGEGGTKREYSRFLVSPKKTV
jgi:hypothetical protein